MQNKFKWNGLIFHWCLYKKRTLHGRLGIQNISLSVEKYFLTWEETFHISLPPYTILYIYVRCDTTFSGKFKDKLCLRVSILKVVLSLQKWQNRWTSYSKPWWVRNYISKTLLKSFQKWPISKFNFFKHFLLNINYQETVSTGKGVSFETSNHPCTQKLKPPYKTSWSFTLTVQGFKIAFCTV